MQPQHANDSKWSSSYRPFYCHISSLIRVLLIAHVSLSAISALTRLPRRNRRVSYRFAYRKKRDATSSGNNEDTLACAVFAPSKRLTNRECEIENEVSEDQKQVSPTIRKMNVERCEEFIANAVCAVSARRSIVRIINVTTGDIDERISPRCTRAAGRWIENSEFITQTGNTKSPVKQVRSRIGL